MFWFLIFTGFKKNLFIREYNIQVSVKYKYALLAHITGAGSNIETQFAFATVYI